MRRLHDATPAVAKQLGPLSSGLGDPSGEAEVVCHCDPTPGNVVFRGGRPVALIDWEYACPGRRAWTWPAALRFWAPLNAPASLHPGEQELDRVDRARAILDGYEADSELRAQTLDLLRTHQQVTASNAVRVMTSRGPQAYQAWVARGGLQRLARDRDWLHTHLDQLRTALLCDNPLRIGDMDWDQHHPVPSRVRLAPARPVSPNAPRWLRGGACCWPVYDRAVLSAIEKLTPGQRMLLEEWLPGAVVVTDHSWGHVETNGVETVFMMAFGWQLRPAAKTDHHIAREVHAHLNWLQPWTSTGRAPVPVRFDVGAKLLVTR